jgi:hypothetical protein
VLGSLTACGADDSSSATAPVRVASQPCDRPTARTGWGVVVAPGQVLTVAHAVDGRVRRTTVDGAATVVVHVDAASDLAVLAGAPSRTAPTGTVTTAEAAAGDDVTIRTGDGDVRTVVERVVVLQVRDASAGTTSRRPALVLRGSVPSGTSGAPVLDTGGALVGVVTLVDRDDALTYATAAPAIDAAIDAANATWRFTGPNLDPTVTCS